MSDSRPDASSRVNKFAVGVALAALTLVAVLIGWLFLLPPFGHSPPSSSQMIERFHAQRQQLEEFRVLVLAAVADDKMQTYSRSADSDGRFEHPSDRMDRLAEELAVERESGLWSIYGNPETGEFRVIVWHWGMLDSSHSLGFVFSRTVPGESTPVPGIYSTPGGGSYTHIKDDWYLVEFLHS